MISNVLFSLEISTRDHRWIGFNTEHTPVTACNYNIFVAFFLTRLWSQADQGSDTALSAATGCFCPPWPWPTWTTFLTSLLTLCWSTSSDNAESREGVLIDASWDVFIGALPKQSADNEQKVFLRKRELFTLIITSTLTEFDVGSSRTLTLVLGTSRDIASISETKSPVSRPDGYGQLNSNHLIHTSQCGYRPTKATITVLSLVQYFSSSNYRYWPFDFSKHIEDNMGFIPCGESRLST